MLFSGYQANFFTSSVKNVKYISMHPVKKLIDA